MIKKFNKGSVIGWGLLLFALVMFLLGKFILASLFALFGGLKLLSEERARNASRTSEEVEQSTKSQKKYIPVLYVLIFIFIFWLFSGDETDTPTPQQATQTTISPEEKQKALKNFTDSLSLMKEGGIITSYDFSETSNVIYVSTAWYTMPVQQKKGFLTSLSTMKEVATGYHRLEVRDAYSNEKVAEVTAFSGSVEIYK